MIYIYIYIYMYISVSIHIYYVFIFLKQSTWYIIIYYKYHVITTSTILLHSNFLDFVLFWLSKVFR